MSLVAAIAIVLIGAPAAILVIVALRRGLRPTDRRGRMAGAAVAVAIVLTTAAMIAWGLAALLIVGVVLAVAFLGALPLIARSDMKSASRHR